MEKIVKLEGMVMEKNFLYYLKTFDDGVYVCRSRQKRGRGKVDAE